MLSKFGTFLQARFGSPGMSMGEAAAFAVRTWLASMLAFWIACKLQLDSPQWAMVTVWIVSRPQTGMMLSRSLYRMWGTLVGCLCGMLLVIFFAQTPELFILALALLTGVCTLFANLLTNFRSYAAALAAYTAAIISLDAVAAPDSIFFIAMARVSCMLLGIACALAVSSVFAPNRGYRNAMEGLKAALANAARRAAFPWSGNEDERRRLGRDLVNQLIALDTLLEFTTAESGVFRACQAPARSLPVHLFGMISAKRGLDAHVRRCGLPNDPGLLALKDEIFAFFLALPEQLDRGEMREVRGKIDDFRARLALLNPEELPLSPEDLVAQRTVVDRLGEMLDEYGNAVDDWLALQERRRGRPMLRANFHRDQRSAVIHGLRAFLAMIVMGAFWIASAWPSGAGALMFLAVIISLISTLPNPDKLGWSFFYAGGVGIVAAFVCQYVMLVRIEAYELFALSMGLFLVPFGFLLCYPKSNFFASCVPITFIAQIAPGNLMDYDLSSFLNSSLAIQIGVLAATIAYSLIFPPDLDGPRRYVLYRVRVSLEIISKYRRIPPLHAWLTRMYDRVSRLQNAETSREEERWLFTGLRATDLGGELYRLRGLLREPELPAELRSALEHLLAGFGNFVSRPEDAARAAREALARSGPSLPAGGRRERRLWARAKSVLEEVHGYFEHPESLLGRSGKGAT